MSEFLPRYLLNIRVDTYVNMHVLGIEVMIKLRDLSQLDKIDLKISFEMLNLTLWKLIQFYPMTNYFDAY